LSRQEELSDDQDLKLTDPRVSLHIKIAVLSTRLQELNDKVREVVKDQEQRIRTLESFRWYILGGGAIASFFGTILADWIFKK
jgi:hypothetical protein